MTTSTVSKLRGTGYSQIQTPRLSPEQQQLFQQVFSGLGPGLSQGLGQLSQQAGGGSPEYWKQLEAPAMRQFGQMQSQLASRFSGLGLGSRRSSGFQNASIGMATDLAERLQSNRMGLQQSAIEQLMGLYKSLMGTEMYDTFLEEDKQPRWQKYVGASLPFIGAAAGGGLGFLAGNGPGALAGAKLGGALGSAGSKALLR